MKKALFNWRTEMEAEGLIDPDDRGFEAFVWGCQSKATSAGDVPGDGG
jgi:hypothetical protein